MKHLAKSHAGFIGKLWRHPKGRIGLILIAALALAAVFAPLVAPYDPYDVTQRAEKGLAPSLAHLLGTTITTGQDIFSMLIYGTRVSLLVGLISGLCITALGSLAGAFAAYYGKWLDMLVMRVVDVLLVIPTLPLTIVLTNLFGKSYGIIILIFTMFGWTGIARVVRSQVLVIKNSAYVKAAELAGARGAHICFRHIIPGVSHLLIMNTALTCAGIMVAEAGLSFLGLGDPTAISWGKMLAEAQSGGALLFGHWQWIIAPGIGIFLSVFAFMRLGLALEEVFNPRIRRSGSLKRLWKSMNGNALDDVFASMDIGPEDNGPAEGEGAQLR